MIREKVIFRSFVRSFLAALLGYLELCVVWMLALVASRVFNESINRIVLLRTIYHRLTLLGIVNLLLFTDGWVSSTIYLHRRRRRRHCRH